MAYGLRLDENLLAGVKRIAGEQSERALDSLGWEPRSDEDDVASAIHDCRKRCKRSRGLVRLVRPALGDGQYEAANTGFRDAARALSPYRDAHALLATFDALVVANEKQCAGVDVAPIRTELARRAAESTADLRGDDAVAAVEDARHLIEHARDEIEGWTISPENWEAVERGVAKTYARGRSALALVMDAPAAENFHQWRKRVKYTWNHLRLLERSASSILGPCAASFHALSDALGDAHDLAVLHEQLRADPDDFGGDDRVHEFAIVVDGRRMDLERRSIAIGRRLFAEKPKHFTRRLGTYWNVWHELGDEPEVGEIAEIAEIAG